MKLGGYLSITWGLIFSFVGLCVLINPPAEHYARLSGLVILLFGLWEIYCGIKKLRRL